ncbi:MAG: flagellar filament capping protein FliD, partial [Clostridiaceae bacterium]|nr:flagellar filament capping protein FliD [Clostridiaceae bacterium]
ITNDTSEFNNTIFKQISDYDTRIRELEEKLIKKEDSLYARFTAMEKALANMNSQSNWLISQFQGG